MTRGQVAANGATRTSPNGYHYTKVKGKWRLTHHLTAEKALGRKLKKGERVFFKDNDRTNFADPDNILVAPIKPKTPNRRKAELEARIADLQAELEYLE